MTNEQILTKAIEKALDGYDIAINGVVTSKKTGQVVLGSINRTGYRFISVYLPETGKSKKINVHKLVALKYLPNPEGLPQINHKDGDRLNNWVDNLEWCTVAHNVQDGFGRGRIVWNKGNVSKERILGYAKKYPRQLFWILTKDDFAFAKALWSNQSVGFKEIEATDYKRNEPIQHRDGYLKNYEYHLQQLVISEDPIAYLGQHLE